MLFDSIHVLAPAGAQKVEPGDTFPSMEAIGQNYGFILYRSGDTSFEATNISFEEKTLHDRVQVFVDGHDVGNAYRVDCPTSLSVQAGTSMDLLVENMGRTNFGPGIYDYKGLMQKPPVSGSWLAFSIPLKGDQVQSLPFRSVSSLSHELLGPVFRRGKFIIAGEPEDTYFDTRGLDKGVIFINGFNLGRYWDTVGPQHALFVPAPLFKDGENEVIVLQLHNASAFGALNNKATLDGFDLHVISARLLWLGTIVGSFLRTFGASLGVLRVSAATEAVPTSFTTRPLARCCCGPVQHPATAGTSA